MHPQPRVQMKKAHERSHHRYTENIRPSLRNGFNGFLRALSPVTGLFCHRRLRIIIRKLTPASGASGPHDFAVRQNAARLASPKRPPHPASTFVTIAKRPLRGGGTELQ